MADDRIDSCFVRVTRVAFRKRYLESKVRPERSAASAAGAETELCCTAEADCVGWPSFGRKRGRKFERRLCVFCSWILRRCRTKTGRGPSSA